MSGFVQVIEFRTSRLEEIRAMNDEWRQTHPEIGPLRITVTADRAREGTYLSIVEFSSYEEAMRNSEDPETGRWAAQMDALCDGPPVFRDLDVVMQEERSGV